MRINRKNRADKSVRFRNLRPGDVFRRKSMDLENASILMKCAHEYADWGICMSNGALILFHPDDEVVPLNPVLTVSEE